MTRLHLIVRWLYFEYSVTCFGSFVWGYFVTHRVKQKKILFATGELNDNYI